MGRRDFDACCFLRVLRKKRTWPCTLRRTRQHRPHTFRQPGWIRPRHSRWYLPLLPSGPDGVRTRLLRGGAHTCAEITTATETRGCLSIYNTLPATKVGSVPPGGVLIPPANGDVTGIQPIATRTVTYVVQNFALNVYDDTIDALEYNPNDPNNPGQITNLIGQFVDVKTVDF